MSIVSLAERPCQGRSIERIRVAPRDPNGFAWARNRLSGEFPATLYTTQEQRLYFLLFLVFKRDPVLAASPKHGPPPNMGDREISVPALSERRALPCDPGLRQAAPVSGDKELGGAGAH